MRGRVLGVVVCVLLAAGGCRRRAADGAAPGSGPASAPPVTYTLEATVGAPIPLDLEGQLPRRVVPTPDGGWIVVWEPEYRLDTFVRRVTADGARVWEFASRTGSDPEKLVWGVRDVAVRGDSVWVVGWNDADATRLVELDLRTGAPRSHRDLEGRPYWIGLAVGGDGLYVASQYVPDATDDDPDPDGFFRIVRVELDGSVAWTVETSSAGSTPLMDPPVLRASPCCVVMIGTSFDDFEVGGVTVQHEPDEILAARLWMVVLSRSGDVIEARSIHEPGGGFRAVVALDETRAHYAFYGAIDFPRDGKLVLAPREPEQPPHAIPLDCAVDFCGARFVEVVPEGILAVLSTRKELVPRLYAHDGRLLAEAPAVGGLSFLHSTRVLRDGSVVAELTDRDYDELVPVTFRVVAQRTSRPP